MLGLCANVCVGKLMHHIWACTSMQAHACMVSDIPILNLLFVHMYDRLYIQEHMESQVHTGQRCTYGHEGAHTDSQMHTWLTGAHMDTCTDTDSCTQPCTHTQS